MLVINERAWFFWVHLDSRQQGKIDVLRKGLFYWCIVNLEVYNKKIP